jgi:hypothetical protein
MVDFWLENIHLVEVVTGQFKSTANSNFALFSYDRIPKPE